MTRSWRGARGAPCRAPVGGWRGRRRSCRVPRAWRGWRCSRDRRRALFLLLALVGARLVAGFLAAWAALWALGPGVADLTGLFRVRDSNQSAFRESGKAGGDDMLTSREPGPDHRLLVVLLRDRDPAHSDGLILAVPDDIDEGPVGA